MGCTLKNDPNHCDQFSTREACEARIDNDPRQPRQACLWATASTFNTGNEACEPVKVEEKCIVAHTGYDQPQPSEQCGDSFVFWEDLGVGTARLTELDRCGYRPGDFFTGQAQPCEFGDPTLPLVCGCACDG